MAWSRGALGGHKNRLAVKQFTSGAVPSFLFDLLFYLALAVLERLYPLYNTAVAQVVSDTYYPIQPKVEKVHQGPKGFDHRLDCTKCKIENLSEDVDRSHTFHRCDRDGLNIWLIVPLH